MIAHRTRPPAGPEMEIWEDTNAMREIYGSHLKLMDLFRLYVGAPSASACRLNQLRRRIRLQISRSWVLLQKIEKNNICNVWRGDRSRDVCNKRRCNIATHCPRVIFREPCDVNNFTTKLESQLFQFRLEREIRINCLWKQFKTMFSPLRDSFHCSCSLTSSEVLWLSADFTFPSVPLGGAAFGVPMCEDKTNDDVETSLILVSLLIQFAHSKSTFLLVVHPLSVQGDQSWLQRSASQRSIKQAAVNASFMRRRIGKKKQQQQQNIRLSCSQKCDWIQIPRAWRLDS